MARLRRRADGPGARPFRRGDQPAAHAHVSLRAGAGTVRLRLDRRTIRRAPPEGAAARPPPAQSRRGSKELRGSTNHAHARADLRPDLLYAGGCATGRRLPDRTAAHPGFRARGPRRRREPLACRFRARRSSENRDKPGTTCDADGGYGSGGGTGMGAGTDPQQGYAAGGSGERGDGTARRSRFRGWRASHAADFLHSMSSGAATANLIGPITTDRLRLRPIERRDARQFAALGRDAEVFRYIPEISAPLDAEAWIAELSRNAECYVRHAVELLGTGTVIGAVQLDRRTNLTLQ